ncbi:hypothetical protein SprV_0502013000 [Sparganum proliferum]
MIKRDDGVELYKDDEKAEHLSRFFQSVFTRDVAVPADHYNVDDVPTIDSVVLTKAIVQQELLKLKEAKSPGPDEIPAKLLKELATELAEPLCLLFQASLDEGRLPPEWKTAWISPIHKSGSRTSANNYRPVSLTSICCKVMERIVKRELMRFLGQHHLLSNAEHGFRRGRSCLTNLLYCLEQWTRSIDEGNVVHVAYIDFKKAFDSMPHQLLLYKLNRIGVRGKLLKWIENFLIGRTQTVRLGGQQSAEVTVTSGVPQGSVLGPILFLIYIDDCIHDLDCDIAMFADDIKLWTVIRNEDDEAKLQANLYRLEQWSGYWLLPFNVSKCNILRIGRTSTAHRQTYYLNHTPLPVVEVQKDLETTVCSSTQFLKKLKGVSLLPNEVMVSFDVTSLFTSIPQDLAIETVELLLRSKYNETENRLGHAQVLQLLKFCLKTYFTFDGAIYEQVKGTPMGSPISGFIAEAVLQRLESLVFQHHRPKFWARYVDDTMGSSRNPKRQANKALVPAILLVSFFKIASWDSSLRFHCC